MTLTVIWDEGLPPSPSIATLVARSIGRAAVLDWRVSMRMDARTAHSLLINLRTCDTVVVCERTKGEPMLRKFALKDGSEIVLCKDHRESMADELGDELGKIHGATWKCRVCTAARRLTGKAQEAEFTYLSGYIVVCTPLGETYCSCPSWRFQKLAPEKRTCKHIEEVYHD